ncbi:MAG: hypothetical protein V2I67_16510 [Thermoanaerobaculales bacterium]|jgi:hypothetical protein|nr:hypothetical protein [Thermoanaerobaculales bacterium]
MDNPFASRYVEALPYRCASSSLDDVIDRLVANHGRGAIVGPHGSGKTTLAETLARRVGGDIVKIHLGTDTRRPLTSTIRSLPPIVEPRHTIVLDGAEQLRPVAWWRTWRQLRPAGTVVITSHKPGRLPMIHECRTSSALLTELATELDPTVAETVDLDELFRRHDGDIRLCFHELYDHRSGR